jgi:hypothetical protein
MNFNVNILTCQNIHEVNIYQIRQWNNSLPNASVEMLLYMVIHHIWKFLIAHTEK